MKKLEPKKKWQRRDLNLIFLKPIGEIYYLIK